MKKTVLILFLLTGFSAYAQKSIRDSTLRFPMLSVSIAGQMPGGDMAKRFGPNGNIGLHFIYKTKSNWTLGIEWTYIYGSYINETSMFDSIKSKNGGFIINNDGSFSNVQLFESGYTAMLNLGKIIPIWAPNPNSGITIKIGAGIMQHQISFTGVGSSTPQLNGDYQQGYDRLTNGFAFSQFIGYTYFSNRKLINFYAGFEFYEGLTRSRRPTDYNVMRYDATKRGDYLSGIRVGWVIPLYRKVPREYYYN